LGVGEQSGAGQKTTRSESGTTRALAARSISYFTWTLLPEHIRSKALIHPPSVITPQKRRGRPRKAVDAATSIASVIE
jgi:hypothetical protein